MASYVEFKESEFSERYSGCVSPKADCRNTISDKAVSLALVILRP